MLVFGGYAPLSPQFVIKLKIRTDRTNFDKFLPISKKVSELFLSPNIVLVTKSSILVQLCSFLVCRLQFSHNWDWNKKIDWAHHFGQVFNYFQKSIRARWGLTFLITEHCFGHEIFNFRPIMLVFGGYAPLSPQFVIKLKIRTDRTNFDKFLPISKKVSELFLSPNIVLVTKSSILVQLCSFLVCRL